MATNVEILTALAKDTPLLEQPNTIKLVNNINDIAPLYRQAQLPESGIDAFIADIYPDNKVAQLELKKSFSSPAQQDNAAPKSLIIFDMHGTAVNSDELMLDSITAVINTHFRAENEHFKTSQECLDWFEADHGFSRKYLLEGSKKEIFGKLLEKAAFSATKTKEALFNEYDADLEDRLSKRIQDVIAPGFKEITASLSNQGFVLGFASNSSTQFLANLLDKAGIKHYFHPEAIIGSDKKPKDKSGDALALALSQVNAANRSENKPLIEKVVFAGDALGDRQCLEGLQAQVKNVQAQFILVNLQGRKIEPTASVASDVTCDGFSRFEEKVNTVNSDLFVQILNQKLEKQKEKAGIDVASSSLPRLHETSKDTVIRAIHEKENYLQSQLAPRAHEAKQHSVQVGKAGSLATSTTHAAQHPRSRSLSPSPSYGAVALAAKQNTGEARR
jgi:phosphoglycolate phosphatase-like HAD superfamily hydrolase